mmetsp:Transcript_12992/g.28204  ORF Transcript_12992/g.28204 Transcript_12992/m.28204 type:complete len:144 (+) Transcript_12992:101-532(+)
MPPPRLNKRKGPLSTNIMTSSSTMTHVHLVFFALLLIGTSTAIIYTCLSYPLFPFQMGNLEWSNAWLIATIFDYYGACLCLCGVILSTEEHWINGTLWSLGCCLLGSPICCLWMTLRLWKHGSGGLRLQNNLRSQYPAVGGID